MRKLWMNRAYFPCRKSDSSSTWLLFEGLDTFTSISFCGQHIAATNNQFRQYYFDVSAIMKLCPTDPVLSINFGSAPNIVDAIQAQPGQESEHELQCVLCTSNNSSLKPGHQAWNKCMNFQIVNS